MTATSSPGNGRVEDLRAFLLGTVDEAEAERIEYALLARPELYELLRATEAELIDEYVGGRLSEAEVSSLLGYLERLPDGRDRIRFARELRQNLMPPATVQTATTKKTWLSVWPWAAAAVLASGLGLGAYVSFLDRAPQTLTLTAGLTRSAGEIPEASRSARGGALRILLELGTSSYDRYRAELYDAESRSRASFEELAAEETARRVWVELDLNGASLEPGDYSFELEGESPGGFEPLGKYVFRLIE